MKNLKATAERTVTMHASFVVITTGSGRTSHGDLGLRWRLDRPVEVSMMLVPRQGGNGAIWSLSRDLLIEGVDRPTGLGDISVLPDLGRRQGEAVEIVLRGRGVGRNVSVSLLRHRLADFLDATQLQVPRGQEHVLVPDYVRETA